MMAKSLGTQSRRSGPGRSTPARIPFVWLDALL
jgi:hypothetical protein